MPESSGAAAILIATSWQAFVRGHAGDKETEICNSIVIIVFAGFFIEANLNYIIEQIDPAAYKELDDGKGLTSKLKWFYRSQNSSSITTEDLDQEFPGFSRIRKFRNDIAHGKIDHTLTNITAAESLRMQAKAIVDKLFAIVEKSGRKLDRLTTYKMAIETARTTQID
jgi:hypothetical protein